MQKFWGKVRKNKGRGKALGFPTANLKLSKQISEGIYLSLAKIDGKLFSSLTFIGKAKTFGENKFQAEVYLLQTRKNLYGKWLSITLLKKIRENKKFKTTSSLVEQIKKDEQQAKIYFKLRLDT